MRYQYRTLYASGKLLATGNTLSRAPVDSLYNKGMGAVELFVEERLKPVKASATARLEEVRKFQAEDETCAALRQYCEEEWPKFDSGLPTSTC